MQVRPLKTQKITAQDRDLFAILDRSVPVLNENEILAISSKIIALCQGRVIRMADVAKAELIAAEADYYLPAAVSRYAVYLTIKEQSLMPGAGIDESNGDGHYVLWPHAPQQTANEIRAYLRRRFARRQVGVLVTDSRPLPLRWGVTGFAVAHSGFRALRDYRGRNDLFGRPLQMTQANVADALATAAVLVMGEGDEQTPIACISEAPFMDFQEEDPTAQELADLAVTLDDDLYAPLLAGVAWERGAA